MGDDRRGEPRRQDDRVAAEERISLRDHVDQAMKWLGEEIRRGQREVGHRVGELREQNAAEHAAVIARVESVERTVDDLKDANAERRGRAGLVRQVLATVAILAALAAAVGSLIVAL